MFDKYLNADGKTYNGVALLSDLSGLSRAEVTWTFERLRYYLREQGLPKDIAKRLVAQECKSRPWEKHDAQTS